MPPDPLVGSGIVELGPEPRSGGTPIVGDIISAPFGYQHPLGESSISLPLFASWRRVARGRIVNLLCVKVPAGWVDRAGVVGHTGWWAGSYEVTPPAKVNFGWGRQVIMRTSPDGESAG